MMAGKNLLEQLLRNAKKLFKVYKRTRDETLIPIIEALLQLAIDESELVHQKPTITLTPGVPGIDEITIPITKPIEPWVQPADPLGPPVMVYGVGMPTVAYAGPPVFTDDKIIVTTEATATGKVDPFCSDSTNILISEEFDEQD